MGKFDHHFKMSEQDAIEYTKEILKIFDADADLTCREIGDGNINYIFRVEDKKSGKSIIIKHADTVSRSNASKIDSVHSSIEAEMLRIEGKLAPGLVPELYHYDPVMQCITMEDCRDYGNMRHELFKHKVFPGFAEQIAHFMAVTLMGTCDAVIPISEKRKWQQKFTNVDLDRVTERLVYTEPYLNTEGKNIVFEPDRAFLEKELYQDEKLHLEVAKLYDDFKCDNQCLIHGDLHTGSIMIKPGSIKVLDAEFATYAPAGYDVGNVIANLIFAWTNGQVVMPEGKEKDDYISWLEKTITTTVDLFQKESVAYLKEHTTDPMDKTKGFAEWFVDGILADTAGVCGLELNRRTIGIAKVEDIASIQDPKQRSLGERVCVLAAKKCIMNRETSFREGNDYIETIHAALKEAEESMHE